MRDHKNPWQIGDTVAFYHQQDEGEVVEHDGRFAIARLHHGGGFYLIMGDPDGYCNGARSDEDEDNIFDTLEAAREELRLTKEEISG